MFRLLVKRGPEGYTPGQLAQKLDVAPATLSFHLKELRHASLITVRRHGRFLFYSPNLTRTRHLVDFLTEHCCTLADADCATKCAIPTAVLAAPRRKRA